MSRATFVVGVKIKDEFRLTEEEIKRVVEYHTKGNPDDTAGGDDEAPRKIRRLDDTHATNNNNKDNNNDTATTNNADSNGDGTTTNNDGNSNNDEDTKVATDSSSKNFSSAVKNPATMHLRAGQNHGRGKKKKGGCVGDSSQLSKELCKFTSQGQPCPKKKCFFVHDIAEYIAGKDADITIPVPVGSGDVVSHHREAGNWKDQPKADLATKEGSAGEPYEHPLLGCKVRDEVRCANTRAGKVCFIKERCRFMSDHDACKSKSDGEDGGEKKGGDVSKPFHTAIPGDVLHLIRKKKYNFELAPKQLKLSTEIKKGHIEYTDKTGNLKPEIAALSAEEKAEKSIFADYGDRIAHMGRGTGAEPDRRLESWRGKTYLAPLTTVGNLPFRRLCKGFGVDITCGEMAMGHNLLKGSSWEWALTKRHPCEDIFGVQVLAGFEDVAFRTTEIVSKYCDIDFIDLNVGCPLDLVTENNSGSALLRRPNRLYDIVNGMTAVSSVPVTVKLRMGYMDNKLVAEDIFPVLESCGAAALAIHGRTRQQRYLREANWEYIGKCKNKVSIPVLGNGDILWHTDAEAHLAAGYSDALMIGRGALIKPWLFTEIRESRYWDISATERLDMLREFASFGFEHWGTDTTGVANTRRYILEFLSFAHRYVPLGIIEGSYTMRDAPPMCFGRSDLETLMMSPAAEDWVKITELVVGKTPPGFKFEPKHKAASYPSNIPATAAAIRKSREMAAEAEKNKD